MNAKYRNDVISRIFRMGHKLGHSSLYCELEGFDPPGVTWQKRKALRKKLVHSLHRALLTQKVSASDGPPAPEGEWKQLMVPGDRPQHSLATISMAHCSVMGGFVFSFDKSRSIGFDMELAERVNDKVIGRIATQEEREQAPDRAFLWTAKEASFKCLKWDKGVILPGQCRIFDWTEFGDEAWLFSFSSSKIRGRGGAFQMAGLAFAYAQVEGPAHPAHQKQPTQVTRDLFQKG